jgi:hypothetical protein
MKSFTLKEHLQNDLLASKNNGPSFYLFVYLCVWFYLFVCVETSFSESNLCYLLKE